MDRMDRVRKVSFYLFFFIGLFSIFWYVVPRHEYDMGASPVALGFDERYVGEMASFYLMHDATQMGPRSSRVIYVFDFSIHSMDQLEPSLESRKGHKVIFFEQPPDALTPQSLAEMLDQYEITVGFLEMNPVSELVRQALALRAPDQQNQVFRVHTIKTQEPVNLGLSYPMILRRWIRAKQERSIDFFWIQPLAQEIGVDYLQYGIDMARLFSMNPEIVTIPVPVQTWFQVLLIIGGCALLISYNPYLFLGVLGYLAWVFIQRGDPLSAFSGMVAALGIAGVFREYRSMGSSPLVKYLTLIALATIIGIMVNAMNFRFETVYQILLPQGVKLTLFFLPFLVFLREFALYGAKNMKVRINWSDLMLLIVLLLVGIYAITRTGNSALVLNIERQFRDWLEITLGIRPRFKEVAGYAALWLYLFNRHHTLGRYAFLVPVLGVIGITTTVNSFQHVHTPLLTVFLRQMMSIGIGTLFGIGISLVLPRNIEVSREHTTASP